MHVSSALCALVLGSILFVGCLASTPIGDSTDLPRPPDLAQSPRGWVSIENISTFTTAPGLMIATGAQKQEAGSLVVTGHDTDSLIYRLAFTPTTTDPQPLDPHEVRSISLWGAPLGSTVYKQLGQTLTMLTGSNTLFDLGTDPLRLHDKDGFTLHLYADYYGDVNRHIQFGLTSATDLDVRDAATGVSTSGQLAQQQTFPLNLTYVGITQGTLTSSLANTSPTGMVTADGTSKNVCYVRLQTNGENQLLTAFTINLNASDSLFAYMSFLAITDANGTIIANAPIVSTSKLGMKFDNLAYPLLKDAIGELHLMIVFKNHAAGELAPRFSGITAVGQASAAVFNPNDVDCHPLTVISN